MLVRKYSRILVRVAYENGQLPFSSQLTIRPQRYVIGPSLRRTHNIFGQRAIQNSVCTSTLCGELSPAIQIHSECKVALVWYY